MKQSKILRRERAKERFSVRTMRAGESIKDYLVYRIRKEREATALGMSKKQFLAVCQH